MMPYYYHSPFFGAGDILSVIIFVIIIAVVIRLFLGRSHRHFRRFGGRSAALELLEERYAKGEIAKDEFEEKRKTLLA